MKQLTISILVIVCALLTTPIHAQDYSEVYETERGMVRHLGVINGNDVFIKANPIRDEQAYKNAERYRDIVLEVRDQGEVISTRIFKKKGPNVMPVIQDGRLFAIQHKVFKTRHEVNLIELDGYLETVDETTLLVANNDEEGKYDVMKAWLGANKNGLVYFERNRKDVITKISYRFSTEEIDKLDVEYDRPPEHQRTSVLLDEKLDLYIIYDNGKKDYKWDEDKNLPALVCFIGQEKKVTKLQRINGQDKFRWYHLFVDFDKSIRLVSTWLNAPERRKPSKFQGYSFFSINPTTLKPDFDFNLDVRTKLNDRALWTIPHYKALYEKNGYHENARLQMVHEVVIHNGKRVVISHSHTGEPGYLGDFIFTQVNPATNAIDWVTKTRDRLISSMRSGGTGEYDQLFMLNKHSDQLDLFYFDNLPYKKRTFQGDIRKAHNANRFKDKNNATCWMSSVNLVNGEIKTKPLASNVLDSDKLNDDVLVIPACRVQGYGVVLLFQQSKYWKDNNEYQEVYIPYNLLEFH